ncbi:unnamed protein product [Musa acuminata var. zebrina]
MIPQTSSLLWCEEVEYVLFVLRVTTSMRYEHRWRDGDAKEMARGRSRDIYFFPKNANVVHRGIFLLLA